MRYACTRAAAWLKHSWPCMPFLQLMRDLLPSSQDTMAGPSVPLCGTGVLRLSAHTPCTLGILKSSLSPSAWHYAFPCPDSRVPASWTTGFASGWRYLLRRHVSPSNARWKAPWRLAQAVPAINVSPRHIARTAAIVCLVEHMWAALLFSCSAADSLARLAADRCGIHRMERAADAYGRLLSARVESGACACTLVARFPHHLASRRKKAHATLGAWEDGRLAGHLLHLRQCLLSLRECETCVHERLARARVFHAPYCEYSTPARRERTAAQSIPAATP